MSLPLRVIVLASIALLTIATPAEAWHARVEGCLQPCSVPTVVTTPDLPWLAPYHPPNPCLPVAGFLACVVF
ncbi:MAG: hypothetical protein LC624_07420 [Halobacteriales archaeon]|nr:hypothetical protein [Halobacteriales archaeon]